MRFGCGFRHGAQQQQPSGSEAVRQARQAVSDGAVNHELLTLCADTIEALTLTVANSDG